VIKMAKSKKDLIMSIEATLVAAKKEPQYYDQKLVHEIEKFINDDSGPSFELILEKAIFLSLGALQKRGMINKITINGENYYIFSGSPEYSKKAG
jgi:predicted TPR repeat methyltransferase